jgi:hypothetical protein
MLELFLYEFRTIMINQISKFLTWFLDQEILFVKGQKDSIFSEEYVLTLEEDRVELQVWVQGQPAISSVKELYQLMVRKEGFYKKPFATVLNSLVGYQLDNLAIQGISLTSKEKAILILLHSFYHIAGAQGDYNNPIRAYLIDLIVIDSLLRFDSKVELLNVGIEFLKASSTFKKSTLGIKNFSQFHFDMFNGNKSSISMLSSLEPVKDRDPSKPFCVTIEIGKKQSAKKVQRYINSGFEDLNPGQYYSVDCITFAESLMQA